MKYKECEDMFYDISDLMKLKESGSITADGFRDKLIVLLDEFLGELKDKNDDLEWKVESLKSDKLELIDDKIKLIENIVALKKRLTLGEVDV